MKYKSKIKFHDLDIRMQLFFTILLLFYIDFADVFTIFALFLLSLWPIS